VAVTDAQGKLSQQEIEKIGNFFRAKFPEGVTCPMCHNKQTEIGQYMVAPVHYGSNSTGGAGLNINPGIVYPQIFLICRVCTHFMYFGAGLIGLLAPAPTPPVLPPLGFGGMLGR
jgi:hypothetical protein